MRNPKPNESEFYFGVLDVLVREQNSHEGFATEAGLARHDVNMNEFMLMSISDESNTQLKIAFKHRDTRNYIFAVRETIAQTERPWQLAIPVRINEAFYKGTFDKF